MYLGNFFQFFIYFNIIFFKAWSQPAIFSGVDEGLKYKHSKLSIEESEYWINKLKDYISIDKPFLNPELTLPQLAEGINTNPRILSQIINEKFNQNFYDFINQMRIEESKRMLVNSSNIKNILEILYETGFNSKATFNRAFKKATGLSPTEYKKRYLNPSVE
jgi:YesN/AraC family two-component response regulator